MSLKDLLAMYASLAAASGGAAMLFPEGGGLAATQASSAIHGLPDASHFSTQVGHASDSHLHCFFSLIGRV